MSKWIFSTGLAILFYSTAGNDTDVRLLLTAFIFAITLNEGRICDLKKELKQIKEAKND